MRLLFLCHAHPDLQAGGTEIFSRDLFRALRARPGVTGAYVAGSSAGQRPGAPGTAFQGIGGAADEMLLWTAGFDPFHLSQTDLHGVVPEFTAFLRELRPDVVHVHHTLQLGMEVLPLIRRVLPEARIAMTLHDYYAICAHDGQMCTADGLLCGRASTDACRRCLPDRSATEFRLRELHVRGALRAVDQFIAPSHALRETFIAWGIAPERIAVVRNGLPSIPRAPVRPAPDGRRDRCGFFGHVNRFKGAVVALEASARLSRAGVTHGLTIHGSTLYQAADTVARFERALEAAPDSRHAGPYRRADQARLMAAVDWVVVPSIWWENAPLVIQEAFAHGRPVICSDVGGMAEAVRDGVDGLHFPVGDATALATVMRRAAEEPGLWERLAHGIATPRTVEEAADEHAALYAEMLRPPTMSRRSVA
jgi:glycosyltransferase involved in cell wall biosynthesis